MQPTVSLRFLLFTVSNEDSTWVDSYRFEWNETSLTYILLMNWTVPAINGFCNIVQGFRLSVLSPFPPLPVHTVSSEVIAQVLTTISNCLLFIHFVILVCRMARNTMKGLFQDMFLLLAILSFIHLDLSATNIRLV